MHALRRSTRQMFFFNFHVQSKEDKWYIYEKVTNPNHKLASFRRTHNLYFMPNHMTFTLIYRGWTTHTVHQLLGTLKQSDFTVPPGLNGHTRHSLYWTEWKMVMNRSFWQKHTKTAIPVTDYSQSDSKAHYHILLHNPDLITEN